MRRPQAVALALASLWSRMAYAAPLRPSSALAATPRAVRKEVGGDLERGRSAAVAPRGGAASVATRRAAVFAATYVAYCCVYLVRKPVSVVKPMLQKDLGATTAELAVVDTAWLTCYAAGQLSLGYFRSVAAPPTLLTVAFLGAGLCTALCSTCASTARLAALWGLNGFFQSCVNPLLVLHVAGMYAASARASAVAVWQTSQQFGGTGANFFAAWLLDKSGWRSIFAVAGGLAALAAAPTRLAVSDASVAVAEAPAKKADARATSASPLALLRLRGVPSVCVAYFVVKMVRYCLMFWLPFFLVKAANLSAGDAAKLATLLDLGGAAGGVCVGLVADRLCGGAMVLACAPFALLTAALLVVHANAYHLGVGANAACMLGVGFAVAAPDGILGGAVARNLCEYNARPDAAELSPAVSGLVNGCGSVGAILQGFGTAGLVAALGWRGLFYMLAGLMALAFAALLPTIALERAALRGRP